MWLRSHQTSVFVDRTSPRAPSPCAPVSDLRVFAVIRSNCVHNGRQPRAMSNSAKKKFTERQFAATSALEEAVRLGLVGAVKRRPVDVAERHSRYLKSKLRAKTQRPG